ncbi:MAG: Lipoprotein signal peptidase [Verrucomicrobiae bacterium]|nr:Lipoprotein signal peptidase [Verrucomicrobiae bacterium]
MRRLVPIAILIAVLDQLSKLAILHTVDPNYPVVVIPGFFRLVNWGNSGAAWGLFHDSNMVLAIISIATLIGLFVFRKSFQIHRPSCQIAFGLIAGGILGNVTDRFRYGHVVDFLDFYVKSYHWPAFNIADSAICVGVGIYMVVTTFRPEPAAG